METRYPVVTKEELELTDGVCIVCREDMLLVEREDKVLGDVPKKLPCGHILHMKCLRSWLERQQTCPTWYVLFVDCNFLPLLRLTNTSRRSVFDEPNAPPTINQNAAPVVDQPQVQLPRPLDANIPQINDFVDQQIPGLVFPQLANPNAALQNIFIPQNVPVNITAIGTVEALFPEGIPN